jgi:hypothetical protein
VQATGDHEVQHQPDVVIEANGDALANASQLYDSVAVRRRGRSVRGSQEKWTADFDALQRAAENARL